MLENATIKCISFTKKEFCTPVEIPITFAIGATTTDTSHALVTPKIIDVLTTTEEMAYTLDFVGNCDDHCLVAFSSGTLSNRYKANSLLHWFVLGY